MAQLYHLPAIDAFRDTNLNALLLGRVFSVWYLVIYATAAMTGAAIDQLLRHRSPRRSADHGQRWQQRLRRSFE